MALASMLRDRTLGQDAQRPGGMSMGADSENAFQKHRVRLVGVVALVCLLLASCVLFVPGIDEVRLVDVQSIEAGTLDLHDLWREGRAPEPPPKGMVGRITVATNSDLHEMAERHKLALWFQLTICETGASVVSESYLYYQGVMVEDDRSYKDLRALYRARVAENPPHEPYTYEIYFKPRSHRKETKGPGNPEQYDPYDFTREPRDLCLRIGAGNMLGGYSLSNTVVIPSGDLQRAFENARR